LSPTDRPLLAETDTKSDDDGERSPLQRFVAAVKATPDELAADRKLIARLLREAQT
jgi:hypothetical protein